MPHDPRPADATATPSDLAALASALTTLDGLIERVGAAAERSHHAHDDASATALYDVERALQTAARKLGAVVRSLR